MWYYDKYKNAIPMATDLYYYNGSNNIPLIRGYCNSNISCSINHQWSGHQDLLSEFIAGSVKMAQSFVQSVNNVINSVADLAGEKKFQKTDSSYNYVIKSWAGYNKKYNGSSTTFKIPQFEFYLVSDHEDRDIYAEIKNIYGDCKLEEVTSGITDPDKQVNANNAKLAGSIGVYTAEEKLTGMGLRDRLLYGFSQISGPPGNFRFTRTKDPNDIAQGTYKLCSQQFILSNLVPSALNVEFSDNLVMIKGGKYRPQYAKCSLDFEFATEVTQLNFLSFINTDTSLKIKE